MKHEIINTALYAAIWGTLCSLLAWIIGLGWQYILIGCAFIVLAKALDALYHTFVETRSYDRF